MSEVSLLLRAPSANRVYAQAAGALSRAEAHWVLGAHLGVVPALRERRIGGMGALEVRRPAPAAASAAPDHRRLDALLGTLSGTLGVLDVQQEDPAAPESPLLRPRALPDVLRHPSDLETTLRYRGKTNEQFTALLVNLAAALSTRRDGLLDGTLDLLDPLCGRGTTLNRALRLGLSPVGAEIDRRDVEEYRAFLGTWLRTHRWKHTLETTRLTVHGEQLGSRTEAELAPDKQTLRRGDGQRLTLLGCDTARLGEVLPARSVDALVGDLPYGVQHGGPRLALPAAGRRGHRPRGQPPHPGPRRGERGARRRRPAGPERRRRLPPPCGPVHRPRRPARRPRRPSPRRRARRSRHRPGGPDPMTDNPRALKLADRIKVIVATMLDTRVKDPRLGFVTITDVRVSGDLQHATVFYTVFGSEEEREGTAAALRSATGMLRREVGRQTGVRLTPTLEFIADAVPENARVIEDLLSEARGRDAELEKAKQGAAYAGDEDPYRKPREEELEDDADGEYRGGEGADEDPAAPGHDRA